MCDQRQLLALHDVGDDYIRGALKQTGFDLDDVPRANGGVVVWRCCSETISGCKEVNTAYINGSNMFTERHRHRYREGPRVQAPLHS